jgi:hypothetical protein
MNFATLAKSRTDQQLQLTLLVQFRSRSDKDSRAFPRAYLLCGQ